MNKTTISICMLMISSYFSLAQTEFLGEYIDQAPPAWYHWVDWDNPNFYDVLDKLDSFKSTKAAYDQELKNQQDEEFEHNPYEMVLQRWYMANKQFVQPDGSIIKDFEAYKTRVQKDLVVAQKNAASKTTGPSNWINIGPNQNYGNGKPTQNLANVYEIIATPNDPNILYCGTEWGGLFKTTDKGITWYSVGDNVPAGASSALAVSPNDPDEVYWAQNTRLMFRSLDGGATWTLLSDFPNSRAERMFVLSNNRVIAGCVDGKVYYSNDKGDTWIQSGGINAQSQISDLAVMPGNDNCVYASTQDRTTKTWEFYRSINYGATFTKVNTDSSFTAYSSRMTVTPANPNVVYVLALGIYGHNSPDFISPKLYFSDDAGKSFSLRCNFSAQGNSSNTGLTNGQGYFDLDIEASPTDTSLLIAGTTTAWISSDGGVTWTALGGYYGYERRIHADIQSIRAVGNDTYITTDGGIGHSTSFFQDTSDFSLRQFGITACGFWGFDQGWRNDLIVGGRYHVDNGSLYDGYVPKMGCVSIGGGENPAGDVVELIRDTTLMGIFSNTGWMYIPDQIKKDFHASRTRYKTSLYPSKYLYGAYNADFMQHPWYAHTFYLGNGNKFYRSKDMGMTYEIMDTFESNVLGFDISRTDPDIIFLCTQKHGLYKSIDGGQNFNPVALPYGGKIGQNYVDVKIDPENENNVWYVHAIGNPGHKVFKSTDQGVSWTNMSGTGPVSTAELKYINIQGGTDGGVYVTDRAGVSYYIDNTMSDWIDFSNNKSLNFYARNGVQIFYAKNKMRMSGNRGIMESPLYQKSEPVALPWTEFEQIPCQNDTVYFSDQSIAQYDGLQYEWSFPGATWVSSINDASPRVTFGTGPQSVTLKITDAYGKSSTTTIDSMITVGDYCTVDTFAGKMIEIPKSNPNLVTDIGTTNINGNNFSISFWVKPEGAQQPLAQMLAIDKCPGSPTYGFGIGFTFNNYIKNLVPCYTDSRNNYTGTSDHALDSTRWNNVVLTYSPDRIVMYVNGWADTVSTDNNPLLDFTQNPFMINFDLHNQAAHFTGWLDEIKFYDYALTQSEVREKMHLIPKYLDQEPGLIKYVQFNDYSSSTNSASDLVTSTPITIAGGASSILPSSAPIATGNVGRLSVFSNGKNNFPQTHTAIWWASGSTYPNGEIVSFELHADPDLLPDGKASAHPEKTYIVNNYGANQTFSEPYYFLITGMNVDPAGYSDANYELFKRELGDYGQTWSVGLSNPFEHAANLANNGYLKFPGTGITSFSQFFISNDNNTDLNNDQHPTVFCQQNNGAIGLRWEIDETIEVSAFELMRSTDGQTYEPIKTIACRKGETHYEYIDEISDAGRDFIHYYRLRYIDPNQQYQYLLISEIDCESSDASVTLWPNPVRDKLSIDVGADEHQPMTYEIMDVQGRTISKGSIEANTRIAVIDLDELSSGSYYFRLRDGGDPTLRKFVKIGK